jgi:hypothetical protein
MSAVQPVHVSCADHNCASAHDIKNAENRRKQRNNDARAIAADVVDGEKLEQKIIRKINIMLIGPTIVLPEAHAKNGFRPDEKNIDNTMMLPQNCEDVPYVVNIAVDVGTSVNIGGSIFLLGENRFCINQGKTTLPAGTLFTWSKGNGLLEDIQRIPQPVSLERNCNIRIPGNTVVYFNGIELLLTQETSAMII